MKSELQVRAEKALERFRAQARGPIVVEFAGLPKAGKTTTISQVHAFLRRCGFRTEIVVERASVCPIKDKKHFNFNVWTACTTLTQVLEKTQAPPRADDPDILILDRGVFDSICWFDVMSGLSRVRRSDKERIEEFLLCEDWRARISGVVMMMADPKEALERERGLLPVEGAGGSIMNEEVLKQMRRVLEGTANRLGRFFKIADFDTSSTEFKGNPKATCEAVASQVLSWIEGELEEFILSVEKTEVSDVFSEKQYILNGQATKLVEKFQTRGNFKPRAGVEADASRVQALPVVVVRNKSGKILRLFRKEGDSASPLHGRFVIWAGGHVRREDAEGGRSAILWGALRELQEELRLCVEPESLLLKGAVYFDNGKSASKHVAIVYEWRAPTEDVEVALCNSEFIERRGTSLKGDFVSPTELLAETEKAPIEEWTALIARNLLSLQFADA
jgi:predicted NUDIX family phosphoesterase